MGCECIPPPPEFDLPPPPDPSLIWDLISPEPLESLATVRFDTCEYNSILNVFESADGLANLFTIEHVCYVLAAVFFFLFAVFSITACALRCRRRRSKRRSSSSSTPEFCSVADTVGNVTHWTYDSMKAPTAVTPVVQSSLGRVARIQHPFARAQRVRMYGSASSNEIFVTPSGFATSKRPSPMAAKRTISSNGLIGKLPRGALNANAVVKIREDAHYCTLGRHYEEIPTVIAEPPYAVALAAHDTERSGRFVQRRPPPISRPPPPPSKQFPQRAVPAGCDQQSASGEEFCSSESSSQAELEQLTASPEAQSATRSRLSEIGGRESGYGTGPSRTWHRSSHGASLARLGRSPNYASSAETSPPSTSMSSQRHTNMSPSLSVFASKPGSIPTMSYV